MATHSGNSRNTPVVAIVSATVLLIGALVAVATSNGSSPELQLLVGAVATTVPSLAALWYAERASRDIRNGTVTEKARQGADKALEDAGVIDVVNATRRGESAVLAMEALAQLLRDRTEVEEAREQRREGAEQRREGAELRREGAELRREGGPE